MFSRNRIALSIVAVSALTIAACTSAEEESTDVTTSATTTTSAAAEAESSVEQASQVTFTDGYAKAKGTETDMTAVFGMINNTGDEEVNLVAFSTDLGAGMYELHETIDGMMQEIDGGFVIPAGETHELAPGSDHLMIMGFPEEIAAGSEVAVTLEFSDGSTLEVENIPVRTIASGEENYVGEDMEMDMDMEMDSQ
ncbi:copper chaperone PCu(A)C [Corynebacterium alimapuense]|uniref:Copper chaperone PCu(A)C n=1 Tax=Corynebacterium alimapuense TaxID=1576874 RepID=A0A3M8K9Z4_9CORY|nr:copper chaperone PCu(A)C [Corynebacterium alimapuense]RNE49278.1 hypothetical protein C5L39_02565 [Corynebacterium alimapuense]